jgi:hypothetical protein
MDWAVEPQTQVTRGGSAPREEAGAARCVASRWGTTAVSRRGSPRVVSRPARSGSGLSPTAWSLRGGVHPKRQNSSQLRTTYGSTPAFNWYIHFRSRKKYKTTCSVYVYSWSSGGQSVANCLPQVISVADTDQCMNWASRDTVYRRPTHVCMMYDWQRLVQITFITAVLRRPYSTNIVSSVFY